MAALFWRQGCMWQPVHMLSKAGCRGWCWVWHCVLDFHQPRFLQEVSGVRWHMGRLVFLIAEICGFGKQHPLLVDFFQRTRKKGLRNYATPFLFLLHPHCGHLLQRGFPMCLVLRDSWFDISCCTLTPSLFKKESAGPHLKNKDGNIYKRRSQFGTV